MSAPVAAEYGERHLVWVLADKIGAMLDSATWLETTRHLRALGWRVTLIADAPDGRQELDGVEFHGVRRPEVYCIGQLLFHRRVWRYVKAHWSDIDLVMCHEVSAPWLLPLRLRDGRHGRRPLFLVDTRTLLMEPFRLELWRDQVRGLFCSGASWLSRHAADGQTALTQRLAEAARIPEHKLWGTWPSGVNIEDFCSAGTGRRWPADGETIELVYIGTTHYQRNLMALCRAVTRARQQGMAFRLTIVGNGTEHQDLARYAAKGDGGILVLPSVARSEVPRMLGAAHIGVLPFPDEVKFAVSSPIKLFEYMASGLAIFATPIACHTDVLQDTDCAFWADDSSVEGLYRGLRRVWERRAELCRMGADAARLAEGHTWRASALRLSAALERGLARCRALP